MNWTIFLLMFPHLKPKCLDILAPSLYRGLDVIRVASLLILAAMFVRRFVREKKLPSSVTWALGFLEGWICLNTFLRRGDYVEVFSIAVSVMAITLLVDFYADRMQELLTSLMLNYEWMVYANLFSVLKYPDKGIVQDINYMPAHGGMPIFFFGPDNWFMYLCIPAVGVGLLYLRTELAHKQWWGIPRSAALIAASYACVMLQFPATAVVAMVVLGAVMLAALLPGVRRCVNFPVALVGGIAANLAIAVFRIVETVPVIQQFVQTRLGKDVTFSGRTPIWDWVHTVFKDLFWFGLGNPVGDYLAGEKIQEHMHNQYYDLLALGGVIALLLFLAALLLAGWKLTVHRKTWSARIMTAAMAGFLIMCIPEVCRHGSIFLLFPLAYHVDKVEEASLPPASEPRC